MAQDVLQLLKEDHQAAEKLLARFEEVAPADRGDYFCEVVHTLVGHEVAEELVVYPDLRQSSGQGDQVADARLREQAEAEEVLARLEHVDPVSAEFAETFRQLRQEVLAHAQAEEATVFPLLEGATDAEQRQALGEHYQKAKESAPTHPHPHSPDTPPGNRVLGPIAALFDRTRDAVQGA